MSWSFEEYDEADARDIFLALSFWRGEAKARDLQSKSRRS